MMNKIALDLESASAPATETKIVPDLVFSFSPFSPRTIRNALTLAK